MNRLARIHTTTQHGMTLIEIMIAMVLGLMVLLGMASLFTESRRNFSQDAQIAHMQEDARFALGELATELSMSGFVGPMVLGSEISNAGTAAGVAFTHYESPVFGLDNSAGPQVFDWGGNLDDMQTGTDAISVRRVEGTTTAEAALTATNYYLKTNGSLGIMVDGAAAAGAAVPAPYEYWKYSPSIYYIRTYCRPGDGIPSLVRRYWNGAAVTTECLARGIENMQVEYGMDTDDDGYPNQYMDGIAYAANESNLAAVRVYLLARSEREFQGYDNTKTYTIANAPDYTPADGFFRRVYSTTVQTRNPTGARTIR